MKSFMQLLLFEEWPRCELSGAEYGRFSITQKAHLNLNLEVARCLYEDCTLALCFFSKSEILERISSFKQKTNKQTKKHLFEIKPQPADMDCKCFVCSFSVCHMLCKLTLLEHGLKARFWRTLVWNDFLFLCLGFLGALIYILLFQVCCSGGGGDKYSKNLNNFP